MANVYLDYAATTPPDPRILSRMTETATEFFANPSSGHADGKRAAAVLRAARERTARALGTSPSRIVFTSGGTESNAIALQSVLRKRGKGHIVISGIEHPSVYEAALVLKSLGFGLSIVDAETDGRIHPDRITAALREDTVLVSVMAVNNETGAVQPVREIASAIESYRSGGRRKIHFHCDAVQAFGKIPFSPDQLGVDSASISAHKIRGPRGAGLLWIRKPFEVLGTGGGQEDGMRPGTENLPGITGLSLAAEQAAESLQERYDAAAALRRTLLERLSRIPGCILVPGALADRPDLYSPFILSASFPPAPGEVLVRVLSDSGYSVSTGSACSTGKRRRVLSAMGVPEPVSFSTIRISLDSSVREEELAAFCDALEQSALRIRGPVQGQRTR